MKSLEEKISKIEELFEDKKWFSVCNLAHEYITKYEKMFSVKQKVVLYSCAAFSAYNLALSLLDSDEEDDEDQIEGLVKAGNEGVTKTLNLIDKLKIKESSKEKKKEDILNQEGYFLSFNEISACIPDDEDMSTEDYSFIVNLIPVDHVFIDENPFHDFSIIEGYKKGEDPFNDFRIDESLYLVPIVYVEHDDA